MQRHTDNAMMEAQMKKSITGNLVKFTFDDNVAPLTFDCTKMSGTNRAYAIPFGMCHRLGDMAAISKSEDNHYTVTEAMRREAILEGIAYYEDSANMDWSVRKAHVIAQNPVWLKLAEKRGVAYEVIAAEKAAADLAELEAM
jgi:hypothetical protein